MASPSACPNPWKPSSSAGSQGGEVFRSGLTYRRGAGNIFYFRPGHETYPTYHDANGAEGDRQRRPLGL
jgi:trehalose utilization protein